MCSTPDGPTGDHLFVQMLPRFQIQSQILIFFFFFIYLFFASSGEVWPHIQTHTQVTRQMFWATNMFVVAHFFCIFITDSRLTDHHCCKLSSVPIMSHLNACLLSQIPSVNWICHGWTENCILCLKLFPKHYRRTSKRKDFKDLLLVLDKTRLLVQRSLQKTCQCAPPTESTRIHEPHKWMGGLYLPCIAVVVEVGTDGT